MKKYIILLATAMGVFASCDSFLDVNDNPNSPTDKYITLSYRLPAALYYTAHQENLQLNQLGSFWSGYWGPDTNGTTAYKKEQLYNGTAIMAKRDGIPVWENGFVYANYHELIRLQADKEEAKWFAGISRIMLAWHFMRLVDVYGDIPFDQAFQPDVYPRPVYEDGEAVYKKSVDLLTQAIALLEQPVYPGEQEQLSKADILFSGDATRWIQLANTMKLRALLRQSQTGNTSYINTELTKITPAGYLSEDALVNPGFAADNLNPFWSTYYRNQSGKVVTTYTYLRPTQYIIDRYEELGDPRLEQLYVPTADGAYKGVIFGYSGSDEAYNSDNTSPFRGPSENGQKPAAILKSSSQGFVLMSAAESYFLQAEAAQRGWITADAKTLYEAGIRASCEYMEVSDEKTEAYLAQAEVTYDASLEQIILQKWLALNSISGVEAWNDYRRLGMPDIPNSQSALPADARPCRLLYPETETQTNIAEVKKRNITDISEARVWWDVD